jgi:hypothetical protein
MTKRKSVLRLVLVTSALVVFTAANSFGWSCAKMQPTTVNTSSAWLKNVTGSACGTLANNTSVFVQLSSTDTDRQLAILLTAVSLGKNVWVNSPATNPANGDTVNVIALQNQ